MTSDIIEPIKKESYELVIKIWYGYFYYVGEIRGLEVGAFC